jgi:hypothetical protein
VVHSHRGLVGQSATSRSSDTGVTSHASQSSSSAFGNRKVSYMFKIGQMEGPISGDILEPLPTPSFLYLGRLSDALIIPNGGEPVIRRYASYCSQCPYISFLRRKANSPPSRIPCTAFLVSPRSIEPRSVTVPLSPLLFIDRMSSESPNTAIFAL